MDEEVEKPQSPTKIKKSPQVKAEDEQDIDIEETLVTNSFKVDLIAEYTNQSEELVLHWGISKKNPGEWTGADDRFLPKDTTRFKDGKACQTKF